MNRLQWRFLSQVIFHQEIVTYIRRTRKIIVFRGRSIGRSYTKTDESVDEPGDEFFTCLGHEIRNTIIIIMVI